MNEQTIQQTEGTMAKEVVSLFRWFNHTAMLLDKADALDVVHRHRDYMDEQVVGAFYQASEALQDQVRALVDDAQRYYGAQFWAEVFGAGHSTCRYSNGGWCQRSKAKHDRLGPNHVCAWAVMVDDRTGQHVCWRTSALEIDAALQHHFQGSDCKGLFYDANPEPPNEFDAMDEPLEPGQ